MSTTDCMEIDLNVTVRVCLTDEAGEEESAAGLVRRAEMAATRGVANAVRKAEAEGFDQPYPEFSIEHVTTFAERTWDEDGNEL